MLRLPDPRSLLVGSATALVVLGLTILPFLTPAWVGFEQGRAQSAAWTGFGPADLSAATDGVLADLVFGPPDFDVAVGGVPVLKPAERAHMRDVRSVFAGFYLAAGAAASILVAGLMVTRGAPNPGRKRYLGAVRAGAAGLAIGLVAAGIVAAVAFDTAFEVFHRLFFPAGTYNFDPQTDRLVQLFPDAFWSETTMVVGAVALVASGLIFMLAGRRLRGATDAARVVGRSGSVSGGLEDGGSPAPVAVHDSGQVR